MLQNDIERIKLHQKSTTEQLAEMKHKMKNLNNQTQMMTKMLTRIIKHLKIEFEEEDIQEDD